jgi:iron complex outermembrane receptor protein
MRNRLWMRAVLAAALATSAGLTLAVAQQPADQTPTLPDTEVEAAPPTLPPTNVEGMLPPTGAGDDALDNYDPYTNGFTFGSGVVEGYRAPSSTTGSIIDIPDADLPATVNVIPRDVLRDQQALQLQDVLRNAGATTFGGGDTVFSDRIFIRGFELRARDFRRDGFLDPTFVPRDFQNIERVEILKGPASTLYGASSPGGIVNLITKKPLDAEFTNFGYTFGSFDRDRFTLDTNGYVNESGSVKYRFNGAQEDADSFRDFGFLSRTLLAPTVRWDIDECTTLVWSGEYHRDDRRADLGFPQVGGNALFFPPNLYVGEPGNDVIRSEEYRQSLQLTHNLSDEWALQVGGSSLFYNYPSSFTSAGPDAIGFGLPATPPSFYRSRQTFSKAAEQSQSAIVNLAGEFYTGELLHKAVIGGEYVYFNSNTQLDFGQLSLFSPDNLTALPYNNPPAIPLGSALFPVFRQQRLGAYVQDWIEVTPQWKVVGGARVDTVDFDFDRTLVFGPPVNIDTEQRFDRVSPRGGVVFQPFADDTLAFYYNYSRSFAPPGGGIYFNQGGLQPVLGEGHELGVKTLLLDNLQLNAAGFYATRQNADLNSSAFTLFQVGEERSQGVDINLIGNVTERWSAVANYAYTDVVLSDALNPAFDGKRQRNVPYNSANFWTRYNVVQDEVHTLGGAIGLVYLDTRPGDLTNTFNLPAFARWDAGLFYNRGRGYATLYAENIFDKYYAASSIDSFQVLPGAPANVRATVGFVY